jgi:hypothetical protein
MKTAKLLDRVFPPFSDVAREKPRDMLFIADEKPDMLTTLVAGTQHVLIILMLTVYVVLSDVKLVLQVISCAVSYPSKSW